MRATFTVAAAREAMERSNEFTWQDHSGILSVMMRAKFPKILEVHGFVTVIIGKARGCCNEIGTQALLNVALAAVRLRVETDVPRPLAWDIAQVLIDRIADLNEVDLRQWDEVHRYCGLPPHLRMNTRHGCHRVRSN